MPLTTSTGYFILFYFHRLILRVLIIIFCYLTTHIQYLTVIIDFKLNINRNLRVNRALTFEYNMRIDQTIIVRHLKDYAYFILF